LDVVKITCGRIGLKLKIYGVVCQVVTSGPKHAQRIYTGAGDRSDPIERHHGGARGRWRTHQQRSDPRPDDQYCFHMSQEKPPVTQARFRAGPAIFIVLPGEGSSTVREERA
jgi:hypothetical protein